jgi:hypothetical protein
MTLQIGLLGSDGLVLASDRQLSIYEAGQVTRTLTSKFFRNKDAVCCWAGDEAARFAAHFIREVDWETVSDREAKLMECAARGWETHFGVGAMLHPLHMKALESVRKVLVACSNGELWQVEVFNPATVQRVLNKIVAGDISTTIGHLITHYVRDDLVPVSTLIQVAAHAICMGHRENPAGIAGLEVAVIRNGTIKVLNADQENILQALSAKIHTDIQELLTKPYDIGA